MAHLGWSKVREGELWEISLKNRLQYEVRRMRLSDLGSGNPFEFLITKTKVTSLQNIEAG